MNKLGGDKLGQLPFKLNETMEDTIIVVDKADLSPTEYASAVVNQVLDPEVPVLTLYDLGVIRKVQADDFNTVTVGLTPTYSGCPATTAIEFSVEIALLNAGFKTVTLETILTPAWTTDWISDVGLQKLKDYGIAPPKKGDNKNKGSLFVDDTIQCPNCDSPTTTKLSQFGSTACKALYKCDACSETFEYFKCI